MWVLLLLCDFVGATLLSHSKSQCIADEIFYRLDQILLILQGMIAIGADTQFEFMADSKSHQRRFKIVDHQTQVPYEICTPDVSSLQKWNYGIQVVSWDVMIFV